MSLLQELLSWSTQVVLKEESKEEKVLLHKKIVNNHIEYRLENKSDKALAVKEVVLARGSHGIEKEAKQYGEGYQMLSQYEGNLGDLTCFSKFTDKGHYKLPEKEGFNTVYNMTYFNHKKGITLLGFSSCRRYSGAFHVNEEELIITLNMENKIIPAGATVNLEEVFCMEGDSLNDIRDAFVDRLCSNHPPLGSSHASGENPSLGDMSSVPTGWCSWYCYGPDIDENIIRDNMDCIGESQADLTYIQIDDGYQPKMGDWLEENPDFGMNMKELCLEIKDKGFEPAVWVAPFIAEGTSKLFTEHPDWFIKDDEGQPLLSSSFTFGGWRCGPWYMLDGTHPEAQAYLTHVFKTMREEWKSHYFKLDANVWGAFPGGHYYDEQATSVEAYRQGMEAVLKGAGEDSFLLGCNAPMWPSLGTVHGMRVTNDISRSWKMFHQLYKEGMNRNWQHGHLWVNDPDCVVLKNLDKTVVDAGGLTSVVSTQMSEDEFDFHKAYILASGGMVLGSDIMMTMDKKSNEDLNKCVAYRGDAAVFRDDSLTYGIIQKKDEELVLLFNPTTETMVLEMEEKHRGIVTEFWCDEEFEMGQTLELAPHSAKVYKIKK